MKNGVITLILSILLLTSIAGSQTINHYGVANLSNSGVAGKITARFKAEGEPLFLIHNLKRGLREGDFIRFKDKMVLFF